MAPGNSLAARFDAAGAAPPFQQRTATSNLLAALKLCAMARDLERGRSIHSQVVDSGAAANPFVASSLVSMYAKCGSVREARRIFDAMPCHSVVSWTALIQGYVENKEELLALDLFAAMARAGGDCQPNGRTFVAVLKACSRLAAKEAMQALGDELVKIKALESVVALHAVIDQTGCGVDIFVANALLDAYARCGSLVDASKVFSGMAYKDVVSWTSLILGFAENSQGEMALQLFELMQRQGCSPNPRTFLAAVKAIAALAAEERENPLELDDGMSKVVALEKVMALHSLCVKSGCQDRYVTSSLVDLYAKCGSLDDSRVVFERARFFDDVVLWTALILAHADSSGNEEQALEIYVRMRSHGCAPDARTYVALLKVCGKAVASRLAKVIHGEICRHGLEHGELVANALVDVYGKCGSAHNAEKVFLSLLSPDAVAHTSLMAGLCRQGKDGSTKIFQIFHDMLDNGLSIDGVTLLCLLTASSHAGLVTQGKQIFHGMQRRTNHLDEAMNFARTMPFKPTAVTWTTILTWCSKWKNPSLGRLSFEKCLEIDTQPDPCDDEKQSQRGLLEPEALA
ncbi:pentatricopeptide repeat-containing protein At4g18520, chloroplastic-like isoform X3 [Selaginella moellendorffii]|uniref:pentatricopeptide repeat-containing protein At4g18520, chloroplastic-like isoform X3 n=1 Tax=Selaginella moellendorffii TaxID=88036 RepID=UPI000D1CC3F4|nr:pentatricopeptide repeat-containing protein At4g18520, chloroplastic-like isoform X3 [Selaginella moellendorffii]|eukprot:XP_024536829.1 pentatricopeptide repeat-containing protein At4g18520, chloroplastic-like isoform X3 [Selaginella moellendorffii]